MQTVGWLVLTLCIKLSVQLIQSGTLFYYFSDDIGLSPYVGFMQCDHFDSGTLIRNSTWISPWGNMTSFQMIPVTCLSDAVHESVNASSCARRTVRPNKLKCQSREQRKVFCRAMQGDEVAQALRSLKLPEGFW